MSEPCRALAMTTLGILIELPEEYIAQIGEAAALERSRRRADRIAARQATAPVLQDVTDMRRNFPRTDPNTSDELPLTRAYHFTYRTEDMP